MPSELLVRTRILLVERHYGGKGLTREARIKVYDWKERGGSEPILKRIAYEVFGLTV
jgi:hypothetical protein